MYQKIKSLFISCLYPLLYFVCQMTVQMVVLQIIFYKYGKEESSIMKVNEKMYIMTLYAAILCFLILFLIQIIKKENIFNYYSKMPFVKIVKYVVNAFGLYIMIVIMNAILIQFFPTYDDQIMGLFKIEQPILAIFVIGIVAPLIEELIFRGTVYQELEKNFSTPMVIFFQAALFGLIHPIGLQKIQTFIMGLFFGYVRAKTKNIWPSTIMHMTNNIIACLLVFVLL